MKKRHSAVYWMAGLSIASTVVFASSHREAPAIAAQPQVDATDFYLFKSYETGRDDFVTLLANYNPLQDAYGGPNYFAMDPNALYEIHVDNDGDAKEDLTFQFQFAQALNNNGKGFELTVGDKSVAVPLKHIAPLGAGRSDGLNFLETYTVTVVSGDRRKGRKQAVTDHAGGSATFIKPYDNAGNKTFKDEAGYAGYANQYIYTVDIPDCSLPARLFVGQRRESFAVNLGETFDLINYVPIDGILSQNPANNEIADKNITTFALEVAASCLTGKGNGVIGAWTTASLRQVSILNPKATFRLPKVVGGAWTQVSRLGSPLVNELVIGLRDKDRFNSSEPKDDSQFADYVTHPTLPALVDILFRDAVNSLLQLAPENAIDNLAPKNLPRTDLVAAFLTGFGGVNQLTNVTASEMQRLNTAIPAVAAARQQSLGVIAGDLAGFPNGRRPGDDVVDIALRAVMGRLCYPIPVNGSLDLGFCAAAQAPIGNQPLTDGAPISASDFAEVFPYLNTPVPGSPN